MKKVSAIIRISGKQLNRHCQKKFSKSKKGIKKAQTLNNFFSNIVKSLQISKKSDYKLFVDSTEDQTVEALLVT